MNATYTATTKNGNWYKWRFTESKRDGDYGNGIYIGVQTPSGDLFSLDRRYALNYDFHKACVDYLYTYYGENLKSVSRIITKGEKQ
jgi:hypothetical protein